MLTSRNNDHRWILAAIVESGNRRFWGWHEVFFVTFFWLLFFLAYVEPKLFFRFGARKFSSAAPTLVACWVEVVNINMKSGMALVRGSKIPSRPALRLHAIRRAR